MNVAYTLTSIIQGKNTDLSKSGISSLIVGIIAVIIIIAILIFLIKVVVPFVVGIIIFLIVIGVAFWIYQKMRKS